MSDPVDFRAGAARVSIEPPLGLPMLGFVRRVEPANAYGQPLEVTALALERGSTRVVLIGVDTTFIPAPEVDLVRSQAAEAAGADAAGVLLNWNHTHNAPPGGRGAIINGGIAGVETFDDATLGYIDVMHAKTISAARLAAERLEPARVVWGVGSLDENVNRRERTDQGHVTLGWNPDGLVDQQVTVLQARRSDESVICTVVGYGCHTVTLGPDTLDYSADFPGPMRDAIRAWTGGECVFLQGAGGNVLPRIAFTTDDAEAQRLGRRLALEALHAVDGRAAWPRRLVRDSGWSEMTYSLYRFEPADAEPPALEAAEERVVLPLQPLPTVAEVDAIRREFEDDYAAEKAKGAGDDALNRIRFHLKWAGPTIERLRTRTAPSKVTGPLHAIRIGDGAIVTCPGEVFAEIGMAVKERSPGQPTFYAGYTNGAIGYLPTAAAIGEGGFEAGYAYRAFGHAANFSPEIERELVEASVRLVQRLFPDRETSQVDGWTASGNVPAPPLEPRYERPTA